VRDNVTMVTVVTKVTRVTMVTISNHGYFTNNQMFLSSEVVSSNSEEWIVNMNLLFGSICLTWSKDFIILRDYFVKLYKSGGRVTIHTVNYSLKGRVTSTCLYLMNW